jgi:dihydroneopterin aldolase
MMDAGARQEARRELFIEIKGISLRGRCGVTVEERAQGQALEIDVRMVPRDVPGAISDDLAGTVDYREVVDVVTRLVEEREYNLVERLATAVADVLFEGFPLDDVSVTVRKLRPPVSRPVAAAAVSVSRRR